MSEKLINAKCEHCPDQDTEFGEIDAIIDIYREKEGCLIQVLHAAQGIYGYLPLPLQRYIADALDLPISEVTGVVSFYSFFSPTPRGEHTIRVCLGTACYVRGGKKLVEHLEKTLGVELGGTTEDGKFTFEIARCIGACGLAPAMMIDDVVYKQVTTSKINSILAKY
ncbi:MAG: NAD(P)H-dependent oxidoreductase subunit E [Clostridiales bacterium]|nr:NAD(P)H-dependent oxidoreductase subunit E [Clostridiales bacterium]